MQTASAPHASGTVVAVGVSMATIRLTDGQQILWPLEQLAPDIAVGSKIFVRVSTDNSADTTDQEALAKTILNQLLKPSRNDHDDTAATN